MENSCLKPTSILILVILGVVATTAQASEFAAHRGLYNLSLVQARSGNGISNAIGKMAIEWNNNCTGWAFQYHSIIDVIFHEGAPVRLSSNASSWESGDGLNYRFSVRHKTNDKEMEHIEGFAKLTAANGAGTTQFTHPKPLMIDLPLGTIFPVAHSLAIMRAAKRGRMPQFVSRTVFDGMDVKGLYQVNAVIGPGNLPQLEDPDQVNLMKRMPSWPVNLAYFAIDSSKAAPDHEVMMLLFANGVVDDLIIDFEDFILRARLSQVELFPDPSCR
ncbi:cell envelope integrity EipB family protein [Alphaproteobacteria bacterium]|nr:cell envelope integrity EipB family protein [Alphaproteobacteria bacterium]